MRFSGQLDMCEHSRAAGWAACGGIGVPVTVRVSGETLTDNAPQVRRPDLVAHGIAENAGFVFTFPEPLVISDTVDVLFPDGSHLRGSPSVKHRDRLRELLDAIDPEAGGIEIGPLSRPILSKKKS